MRRIKFFTFLIYFFFVTEISESDFENNKSLIAELASPTLLFVSSRHSHSEQYLFIDSMLRPSFIGTNLSLVLKLKFKIRLFYLHMYVIYKNEKNLKIVATVVG